MKIRTISLDNIELQQIAHLYHEVWGGEHDDFFNRFKRHASYPGFQGMVAMDGKDIIGFAYGYISTPGQHYHELLRKSLEKSNQEWWLEDCFEFVELAVHPNQTRKKLGQELIKTLLEETQNQTALLSTQRNNTSAIMLYEKLNWKTLEQNFKPGMTSEAYVIMGKKAKTLTNRS